MISREELAAMESRLNNLEDDTWTVRTMEGGALPVIAVTKPDGTSRVLRVKRDSEPAGAGDVWDYTTGGKQPATAYVNPDGSYVVVNDETGQVVQVSNRNNPNWKPVWKIPRFQR